MTILCPRFVLLLEQVNVSSFWAGWAGGWCCVVEVIDVVSIVNCDDGASVPRLCSQWLSKRVREIM